MPGSLTDKSGALRALFLPACAFVFGIMPGLGAELPPGSASGAGGMIAQAIRRGAATVETVTFGRRELPPVKVVRGLAALPREDRRAAAPPAPARRASVEIVTFDDGRANSVTVVRGGDDSAASGSRAPEPHHPARGDSTETVTFADPRETPVTVVRGPSRDTFDMALFDPARGADLDRIAFAVDGAESSHGADPRMWRAEVSGPQGPMQVSEAAALDVGGGNRFDEDQNRVLGRAYLARMFERYGNWPDAIAAYNWGPGSMDLWISLGRPADRLPLETERYVERVLREVLLPGNVFARDRRVAPSPPAPAL